MKKIIFGLLGLVLIITGVFIFSVVRSFDVNSYKKQVVASLEQLTGRHVSCSDEATLSWRPHPTFVMNDLVISNQDGSKTANMVSIKQIQVEMDWSSFLRSTLSIKRVILKNPNVLLERLHTYQTNFNFPYLFNPGQTPDKNDIITDAESLRINSFEVQNGTVTYHNELNSETVVFQRINGYGKIDSIEGPFSFDGRFGLGESDLDFSLTTNKISVSQPLSGKFLFSDVKSNTSGKVACTFASTNNSDWLQLEGDFTSQKPVDFFARFIGIEWPDLGEMKGNFNIAVNTKSTLLKELVLVQGTGDDEVSFTMKLDQDLSKKEKLSFVINQLDYDLWGTILEKFLQNKFLQTAKDLTVDFSVSKLLWHENIISDLLLQGNLSDGSLDGNLSALLPQESQFSAKGKWNLKAKSLKSELVLKTNSLRDLIGWFFLEKFEWLPDKGVLSSHLTADLDMSEKSKILSIKSANVDESKISGSIEWTNNGIKTDLNVQDIDVDLYYPEMQTPDMTGIKDWLKNQKQKLLSFRQEGSLKFNVSNITLFQQKFNVIDLDSQWRKDEWNIKQLSIKKQGDLDVKFSGNVAQWGTPDLSVKEGKLEFNISKWREWNEQLHITQNEKLSGLNSLSGHVDYSGNFKEGQLDTNLTLDKTELWAKGSVTEPFAKWNLNNMTFHLKNPNFSNLMYWLFPDKKWQIDSDVDFSGVVSANSDQVKWENSSLLIGRDSIKTSGVWTKSNLDIKVDADKINMDNFLPPLNDFYALSPQPLPMPSDLQNMNFDVAIKEFSYSDLKGTQLKLKGNVVKRKLNIISLDCLVGNEKPGRLSVDGSVELGKVLKPEIVVQWDKIPLNKNELRFGNYRFSEGVVSGKAQVKSIGNSWSALINSATGTGQMSWDGGILYGLDASAWLTAVQAALAAEKITQGFSSRLQSALKNGKTALPNLSGNFKIAKGFLNFTDVKGSDDLVTLAGVQVDLSFVKEATRVKMPIILTPISKLPPVVLDLNYNNYSIQSMLFEQSFDEELRLKNRQTIEARQLQALKETELKNQKIRTEAQDVMNKMETTLKQLQERVALRSDVTANEQMDALNYTAREIRELAVKTDLTQSEYAELLEKARLWSVQVTELNNYYARQELLSQKLKTNQLSPLVSNYLASIEQIYQQHPQSVILAEIVMNARQVASVIKADEAELSAAQDAKTAQSIIIRIQDNFDKVEKAHQYAQRLHLSLMNGGVNL